MSAEYVKHKTSTMVATAVKPHNEFECGNDLRKVCTGVLAFPLFSGGSEGGV